MRDAAGLSRAGRRSSTGERYRRPDRGGGRRAIEVDHVIGSKLLEERHRHERAEAFREVLADATNAACSAVLGTANADEEQIVIAAQGRNAVLVAELIAAAVELPEGFTERDSVYPTDPLREASVGAGRAWSETSRLRELVSAFDTFADLDSDWAKCIWTKSARYSESVLFREQRSVFGEVGSLEFGLNLARVCRDNPSELWLPTARQASDLARQLWAGGIASYELAVG